MPFISYDFHLHSCLSPCGDDDMTPGNIVNMACLIGLNAIALTDHNSTRNCPAFCHQAEKEGILAIPGMELNTSEEVHVLCYFANLEDAMRWGSYVEEHLLPIANRPEFFGNQYIMDDEDEVTGIFPTLLISATDISFSDVPSLMEKYHGIMVPAHINKSSNSLISNLGFIPPDSSFLAAEVSDISCIPELKKQHPYLRHCFFLCSSDAHNLMSLHEANHQLEVDALTATAILKSIC